MTHELTGYDAISYAERHDLDYVRKYADPTEDYRDDVSLDEARKIAMEAPGLIHLRFAGWPTSQVVSVPATKVEDYDDCLQAAVEMYVSQHPEAEGYDMSPRWDDGRAAPTYVVPFSTTPTCRAQSLEVPTSVELS